MKIATCLPVAEEPEILWLFACHLYYNFRVLGKTVWMANGSPRVVMSKVMMRASGMQISEVLGDHLLFFYVQYSITCVALFPRCH